MDARIAALSSQLQRIEAAIATLTRFNAKLMGPLTTVSRLFNITRLMK